MIEFTENKLIDVKEYKTYPIELTIEDEYNTDKLCEYFEQHRRVMIRADYPGSGKSYACRKMMERDTTCFSSVRLTSCIALTVPTVAP